MKKHYKKTKLDFDINHLPINRVAIFYRKMFLLLAKYQEKQQNLLLSLKSIRKRLIVFDKSRFVHAFKNKRHYILYIDEPGNNNYYVEQCEFTPTKLIKLKEGNGLLFLSERIEVIKRLLNRAENIISTFCKSLIKNYHPINKFSIEGVDFYIRLGEFFSSLEISELKL